MSPSTSSRRLLGAAIAVLLLLAILLCTLLWTRLVERRALRRLGVGA